MASFSKQSLLDFEGNLDRQVPNLPLLSRPLRSVLTSLYVLVDGLFNGNRLEDEPQRRLPEGRDLAARLSYLIPIILKCPTEPSPGSAFDALSGMNSMDIQEEFKLLIGYGHLCELMPEVHRNYYEVSSTDKNFYLSYRKDLFCQSHVKDIVLTELARPFLTKREWNDERIFDSQVESFRTAQAPVYDLQITEVTIKKYYLHHLNYSFEHPIISDQGFMAAVGTTFEEFCLFRAAWHAVADYCLGMASALCRKIRKLPAAGRELEREFLEWIAVMLKETFLRKLITTMSGLTIEKFDSLITIFSIGPCANEAEHVGDGFFPPMLRLENSYFFNPNVMQLMLISRNILYALNKLDREHFDNFVSQYMEPQLITAASKIFERIKGVQIVPNYDWNGGEFDLLVYRSSENVALHVQAKATIPPDGARMLGALEKRSMEGLKQLQAFRALGAQKIDSIVSNAVKSKVKNVKIVDVLLGWAGFGTNEVWEMMTDVAPMNLALLCNIVDGTPNLSLLSFREQAHELINKLCDEVSPQWKRKKVVIGDTIIEVPLLDFNAEKLTPFKIHLRQR
jgi:hypothetical protein